MFEALDFATEDRSHPIPNLDVIDVHAVKKTGGSRLSVIIASALDSSPRSVFRLFRKLNGHLNYLASDEYRQECGPPTPERTEITVSLHKHSDPAIAGLLRGAGDDCAKRGASLRVERIG